jgi:plasmid stabilization system protein ParE
MKIIWSPLAVDRIAETASYISQDSSAEAVKWVKKIFNSIKRLEAFPESGRIVPEINNHAIREIIHGNYRIIYEISEKKVEILTVRNFKRQIDLDEIHKR